MPRRSGVDERTTCRGRVLRLRFGAESLADPALFPLLFEEPLTPFLFRQFR